MLKILILTVMITALSYALPKRGIVYPSDDEFEQRYRSNKVNTRSSYSRAILFPEDDYDDKSGQLLTNKVNYEYSPRNHKTVSKHRILEVTDAFNSSGKDVQDVTFEDRFLFRTRTNCPCKVFGRCMPMEKCKNK